MAGIPLTVEEKCEFIDMIANGVPAVDIGKRFSISSATVSSWRAQVYGELRVRGQRQLMWVCASTGILAPPGGAPNFQRSAAIYTVVCRARQRQRPVALAAGMPVMVIFTGMMTPELDAVASADGHKVALELLRRLGAIFLPGGGVSLRGEP